MKKRMKTLELKSLDVLGVGRFWLSIHSSITSGLHATIQSSIRPSIGRNSTTSYMSDVDSSIADSLQKKRKSLRKS